MEIYTNSDGGVIFKKYSLMGGLGDFVGQMCDTLNKTTGHMAIITDRDTCLAVAGPGKRELTDRPLSQGLEQIMESRGIYQHHPNETPIPVIEGASRYLVSCAAPILAEGDVLGCVLFAGGDEEMETSETDYKLVQTISTFLGRHMEA
ncbi:stage V sporulation T C-terminal domain-containing protein [Pseudoflavonifractor phocaeensis]|uniref:stage V sporulation T C-terminal domain-containing protein n=1 Tax=Pseudoflavonifractor phocaeensis TaxID=1870988 RepID=UPI001FAFBE3D|nr:stage V sporulation T C-terminal domain-containing protein [Pseudoflavonifractor phocaeensis]